MSNEPTIYGSGAWGQQLGGGQPDGHLATLDAQHAATPQRIEAARGLGFTEAAPSDFVPFGNRGKLRHKVTGVEYVLAEEQVLMASDPRKSGVEYFIIAGGQLRFLRRRGWDGNREVGIPGQIVSGQLKQSPGGGIRVVDARTGATVREGLRL